MVDSVRVRLALWYVGVLALVLVVFSIGVYVLLSRALHERIDDGLRSLVEVAIKSLTNDLEEGQTFQSSAQSTAAELFNSQQALAIFDGSGRLLAENSSGDQYHQQLPDLSEIPEGEINLYTALEEDDDDYLRLAVRRVKLSLASEPYIILAGQSLEPVEDELESLTEILFYAVPTMLLMAGLGGWFLARQSLAPVVAMSERARRIGAENLDKRLPIANPRDELGQLAMAFNELLERLSAAFAQQRQFMADASHELRTPLSVIYAAGDVTLEQPHREEGEYRDAIAMMNEQTRRLTRIVEDMFTLARADAGRYPLRQSKFYLDEMLEETARAGSILAASKNITIKVGELSETPFYGDEDLLRQMTLNLLENAIKHTLPGGVVRLSLSRGKDTYQIEVSDNGPGIPPESQPHIFERFYRADKARSRSEAAQGGGAGLGLAIARWIVEAHKGNLVLSRSDQSGTTFVVVFPAASRN